MPALPSCFPLSSSPCSEKTQGPDVPGPRTARLGLWFPGQVVCHWVGSRTSGHPLSLATRHHILAHPRVEQGSFAMKKQESKCREGGQPQVQQPTCSMVLLISQGCQGGAVGPSYAGRFFHWVLPVTGSYCQGHLVFPTNLHVPDLEHCCYWVPLRTSLGLLSHPWDHHFSGVHGS